MLQITLIEEEDKYEKIQNVNPNVIQNRPDLLGELHEQGTGLGQIITYKNFRA